MDAFILCLTYTFSSAKPCLPKIQKLCTQSLVDESDVIREKALQVLVLLHSLDASIWEQFVKQIVKTLHSMLNEIAEGKEELKDQDTEVELIGFEKREEEIGNIWTLQKRMNGLTECLCRLLSSLCSKPCAIPVESILNLSARCLNVEQKKMKLLDKIECSSGISFVKHFGYQLLKTLIHS